MMQRLLGKLRLPSLIVLTAVLSGCSSKPMPNPVFRPDLRLHGLQTASRAASYNEIAFLTNSLVLVAINQRTYWLPVEPGDVDKPPAKLLLFDINKKSLERSAELPVEKSPYALQALAGARFVIRNESGIQICTADLSCGDSIPIPGGGPLLASPAGTSFIAGGYGDTEQILFNGSSLRELSRFSPAATSVLPGDNLYFLRYREHAPYFNELGKTERPLPLRDNSGFYVPDSRFLSNSTVGFNESNETLLVSNVNGEALYRLPVFAWYRGTALISSAGGERFGIRESNYSRWNSVLNFMDIENNRTYDIEKIRVLAVENGKPLFELTRDPRPYLKDLTLPALSPDGHHLATIYRGFLEVYEIH